MVTCKIFKDIFFKINVFIILQSGNNATPDIPTRAPVDSPRDGKSVTAEVVRINTAVKSSMTYANVSADIQRKMKNDSSYESSFRPGVNAKMIDNPPKSAETILKKSSNNKSPRDDPNNVTFAEDRVMENAEMFIKKYPNATVLVTADIHPDNVVSKREAEKSAIPEPEPDYDDDDKSNGPVMPNGNKAVTVIAVSSGKPKAPAPTVNTPHTNVRSHDDVAQNNNVNLRPTSAVVEGLSQRPSSVYGEPGKKKPPGLLVATAMTSAVSVIRSPDYDLESDPMKNMSAPPTAPPPPPVAPPPPPVSVTGSASSTLRGHTPRSEESGGVAGLISSQDIMAAVAQRQQRLEIDGPREREVKPTANIPISKF